MQLDPGEYVRTSYIICYDAFVYRTVRVQHPCHFHRAIPREKTSPADLPKIGLATESRWTERGVALSLCWSSSRHDKSIRYPRPRCKRIPKFLPYRFEARM